MTAVVLGPAFWADENVAAMTPLQHWVHLHLLRLAAQNGSIPADPARLAAIVRLPARRFMAKVWPGVAPCWLQRGDRLVCPTLHADLAEQAPADPDREVRQQRMRDLARRRWQQADAAKDAHACAPHAETDAHAYAHASENGMRTHMRPHDAAPEVLCTGTEVPERTEVPEASEVPAVPEAEPEQYSRAREGDAAAHATDDAHAYAHAMRDACGGDAAEAPPATNGKSRKSTPAQVLGIDDCPSDVAPDVWRDFLTVRKGKRAAFTPTALDRVRAEAAKARWTLEEALREAAARGWQGFKSEWVAETAGPGNRGSPPRARPAAVMANLPRADDAAAIREHYRDRDGDLF